MLLEGVTPSGENGMIGKPGGSVGCYWKGLLHPGREVLAYSCSRDYP